MNICSARQRGPRSEKERGTHGDEQDGVEACACARVEREDRAGEGDLEHLAEDVDAEAHDDDRGDVDPARADLNRLEDEQRADGDQHCKPRDQPVDGAPDERRHRHAEDAHEPEEPDYQPGAASASVGEACKGRTWSSGRVARRAGTST